MATSPLSSPSAASVACPSRATTTTAAAAADSQLLYSTSHDEQQNQQQQEKKKMLEKKAEKMFGYSLSTPNLNMRQNSCTSLTLSSSSLSPRRQQPQQQHQYMRRLVGRIQENHHCLSAFQNEVNSPEDSSALWLSKNFEQNTDDETVIKVIQYLELDYDSF